ncbi:MAG: hypothetical protein KJ697_04575 [Nanoarchaeota archaeon]|nr:hypothetical protein [Nanoarchaeota archaeon]
MGKYLDKVKRKISNIKTTSTAKSYENFPAFRTEAEAIYRDTDNKRGLKRVATGYLDSGDINRATSIFKEIGDTKGILSVAEKVEQENNGTHRNFEAAAALYHMGGKDQDAIRLARVLENDKSYYSAARVYEALGDQEKANTLWEKGGRSDMKKNKKTIITAISILALFGMYLLSLQGSVTAGYATCVSDGNVLIGGIALIVIILLFVLVRTHGMGKEVIRYVPMKTTKRKVSSK